MAKKFDTNPLDSDFPEKIKAEPAEVLTQALPAGRRVTRKFADPPDTEEQTRKLDDFATNGFVGGTAPQNGPMMTPVSEQDKSNPKHSIGSISLPENVLMALAYVPFAYIGLIAGIIELIFIPKNEPRVRYHAAQGVAAHLGIALVMTILGAAGIASDLAGTASWIFGIVTTIMLIVFAFKAWQGKPIHIQSVETLTDWLEDKISPSK